MSMMAGCSVTIQDNSEVSAGLQSRVVMFPFMCPIPPFTFVFIIGVTTSAIHTSVNHIVA